MDDQAAASGKRSRSRGRKATSAAADGRARYEIEWSPGEVVGHRVFADRDLPAGGAEEYNAAHKRGVRSFTMWSDPHRERVWARVVTARAESGGPMRYEAYGAEGEFVGRVTRERSFTGGHVRTRWSVEQAGGPAAVGYKGRCFWWAVWWLISPVQGAFAVLSLVEGGIDLFRMPRRVGYRAGGSRVLDFGRGAGMEDHFKLTAEAEEWDPRLLAALVALHCSHDGITGESWDRGARGEAEPCAGEGALAADGAGGPGGSGRAM